VVLDASIQDKQDSRASLSREGGVVTAGWSSTAWLIPGPTRIVVSALSDIHCKTLDPTEPSCFLFLFFFSFSFSIYGSNKGALSPVLCAARHKLKLNTNRLGRHLKYPNNRRFDSPATRSEFPTKAYARGAVARKGSRQPEAQEPCRLKTTGCRRVIWK
jgi:hypothetical protein